jgi:hypothetical protein
MLLLVVPFQALFDLFLTNETATVCVSELVYATLVRCCHRLVAVIVAGALCPSQTNVSQRNTSLACTWRAFVYRKSAFPGPGRSSGKFWRLFFSLRVPFRV